MKKTAPPLLVGLLAVGVIASTCAGMKPNPYANSQSAKGPKYSGFTEPVREIEISASESGPIVDVPVKRGMIVDAGQLLLTLDTKVLEANRKVAEAKSASTSRIDALSIEAKLRQKRYEKLKQLYEDGAGSIEEVERAKADAAVAALEVDAAREEHHLRKLELKELEAKIDQRRLRSPIAGVVTEIAKEPGEYVSLQDPHVATVVQLSQLRVTFFVPTHVAASLKASSHLQLMLPETNQRCTGIVEYVGVVTEADSGRVRLDVLIDNADDKYRSGVRCEIQPKR